MRAENSFVSFGGLASLSPGRKKSTFGKKRHSTANNGGGGNPLDGSQSSVTASSLEPSQLPIAKQRQSVVFMKDPSAAVPPPSPRKKSEAGSATADRRPSMLQGGVEVKFGRSMSSRNSRTGSSTSSEGISFRVEDIITVRRPSAEECLSAVLIPETSTGAGASAATHSVELDNANAFLQTAMSPKKPSALSVKPLTLSGSALLRPSSAPHLPGRPTTTTSSNSMELVKMLMEVAALHCAMARNGAAGTSSLLESIGVGGAGKGSGAMHSGIAVEGSNFGKPANSPRGTQVKNVATQTSLPRPPPSTGAVPILPNSDGALAAAADVARTFLQSCSGCCLCNRHHAEGVALGLVSAPLHFGTAHASAAAASSHRINPIVPRRPLSGHMRSAPSVPLPHRVSTKDLCLLPERFVVDHNNKVAGEQ